MSFFAKFILTKVIVDNLTTKGNVDKRLFFNIRD